MNKVFDTFRPEGFGTVSSYIFSKNPNELVNFLINAFYAEEIDRSLNPTNGEITNVILKIGNSCFMISPARGKYATMRAAFYL